MTAYWVLRAVMIVKMGKEMESSNMEKGLNW